eukprot:CAMPEP_0174237220 /NCGR_PEP_ID=MMETSP0417-20130205/7352_1 /TAXON_ID=242541 /ORGANISM="Mayorella sp, Strain BSH-02190019" /LENGTH=135 /DNA_ID=CAMNT_0015315949 /DNA_START=142 /DNA_END=546 /DNA_ORIENTATION=+
MSETVVSETDELGERLYLIRPPVEEQLCASGNLLQEFGLMEKHTQLSASAEQKNIPQDYFGFLEGMLERGANLARFPPPTQSLTSVVVKPLGKYGPTDLIVERLSERDLRAALTLEESPVIWPSSRKKKDTKRKR